MFILSVYLFILPGIACGAEDNCKNEPELLTSRAADEHKHEKEACGNLCSCSCCVHIVSVHFRAQLINIEKPEGETAKHAFYHNISLPSNYFGNIWQPPRVD